MLLNKCQEEFEAGDSAMKAVDAREKAAAEKKASGEVRSKHICSTLNDFCSCGTFKMRLPTTIQHRSFRTDVREDKQQASGTQP